MSGEAACHHQQPDLGRSGEILSRANSHWQLGSAQMTPSLWVSGCSCRDHTPPGRNRDSPGLLLLEASTTAVLSLPALNHAYCCCSTCGLKDARARSTVGFRCTLPCTSSRLASQSYALLVTRKTTPSEKETRRAPPSPKHSACDTPRGSRALCQGRYLGRQAPRGSTKGKILPLEALHLLLPARSKGN